MSTNVTSISRLDRAYMGFEALHRDLESLRSNLGAISGEDPDSDPAWGALCSDAFKVRFKAEHLGGVVSRVPVPQGIFSDLIEVCNSVFLFASDVEVEIRCYREMTKERRLAMAGAAGALAETMEGRVMGGYETALDARRQARGLHIPE